MRGFMLLRKTKYWPPPRDREQMKRWLQKTAVLSAVTALAATYLWLIRVTTRWHTVGGEIPQSFRDRDEPFVLAVWHGRLLMVAPHWPREASVVALISKHRDGELIARTVAWYGMGAVRGSSHPGDGATALRSAIKALDNGNSLVFTPDGPRGPRMRAGPGIISAARLSGAKVVPFAFGMTRRRLLRSWDRFLLPLPWGRGALVWGPPIRIERSASEAEIDTARKQIEAALNRVTEHADALTGHKTPEPSAVSVEAME